MTVAIRDRFWALMDEPSPLIEAIQYRMSRSYLPSDSMTPWAARARSS